MEELSLAHTVSSSVEQAYARVDLIEERRRLINDWASFVAKTTVGKRGAKRGQSRFRVGASDGTSPEWAPASGFTQK